VAFFLRHGLETVTTKYKIQTQGRLSLGESNLQRFLKWGVEGMVISLLLVVTSLQYVG